MPSLPNKSHFNTDVAVQHEQDFVTNTVMINSVQGPSVTFWTVTVFLCLLLSCILGKPEECGERVERAKEDFSYRVAERKPGYS